MGRVFGELPGWEPGLLFADRIALAASGIHKPTQAGISHSAKDGADSIVLSGGYADDEDYGNIIVYTGMGGRDPRTGKQIADQELDRGNLALSVSMLEGLPVRVTRGSAHASPFSPKEGYLYAGLYRVEDAWHERGVHGYLVWRYRLVRQAEVLQPSAKSYFSATESVPPVRQQVTIQRIIRDTQKARSIKKLHEHKCQVCGIAVPTPEGPYAEAAHIRPLGKPHDGPDVEENILCLCPNHHVMFDCGAFCIGDDFSLIGLPGTLHTQPGHKIGLIFLKYHREHYKRT